MYRTHKAGITVFTVLILSVVAGCLLTLLEGARYFQLNRTAHYRTQTAIESAFAKYNTSLWENYHLLGCEAQNLHTQMNVIANEAYKEKIIGTNLLLLKPKEVQAEEYTLFTDGEGAVYLHAVSVYMKENVLYEAAKGIYNQYQSIEALLKNHSSDGSEVDKALESLEDLKKEKMKMRSGQGNLLETIQRIQKTQLLELVVPDTSVLSEAECNLSETVSHRKLQSGTIKEIPQNGWLERILVQQYLLTYMADYTNSFEGRGLNYELEYIISGKNSDIDNLRTVVNELLLLREAANWAYLNSDVQKVAVAQGMATTLAGVSVNPLLIEAVKQGILAAWAFGESVLDVRALLQGKKIPLIKSDKTWTLELENLGRIAEEYMIAKESEFGLSYKSYLGFLLLFQKDKTLAYRGMDAQELTLQKSDGCVKLDELAVWASGTIKYRYAPIFSAIVQSLPDGVRNYEIICTEEYGYY